MNVVGTQNAHNLISISTDGRLCSWSLDMLSQPQEILELHRMQSKPVAVTCLDFPHSDVNNFVIGSEEGSAYSACRHGVKAGIVDTYDGHQGPVTGIGVNAVQGGIDFSHLFLTSSIDWTMKLWSLKVDVFILTEIKNILIYLFYLRITNRFIHLKTAAITCWMWHGHLHILHFLRLLIVVVDWIYGT